MTEEQKDKWTMFAEKYGLIRSDFFVAKQGFVVITRTGIEKIQRSLKIVVHYEVVPEFTDPLNGLYVVKATGGLQDDEGIMPIVESYGECSPKNNRNAYPVAMAEKRALSRVVLKMADLYELGVYGEDELDK